MYPAAQHPEAIRCGSSFGSATPRTPLPC